MHWACRGYAAALLNDVYLHLLTRLDDASGTLRTTAVSVLSLLTRFLNPSCDAAGAAVTSPVSWTCDLLWYLSFRPATDDAASVRGVLGDFPVAMTPVHVVVRALAGCTDCPGVRGVCYCPSSRQARVG